MCGQNILFCAQRYGYTCSEVLREHAKTMVEAFAMNLMVENELRLATFLSELTSLRDRQLFVPGLLDV